MFIIGITGGIGCGKSTAASICREAGLTVIDADEISRQVTASGGVAVPEISARFGADLIDSQGCLDRQAMARKVFQNHRALDQLSAIVHRHVFDQIAQQVKSLTEKNVRAVVLDVPIPVKSGFMDLCDQVWVIWADEEIRLARLTERGMEKEEARRRIAMQMTREEYLALADHVFANNGSREDLAAGIRQALKTELEQRGIRIQSQL